MLVVSGGETFSLSAARKNERNILARLQQSRATKQLYQDIWHEKAAIEAITAHHLRQTDPSACKVQEPDTWLMGQFNICIIVHIHSHRDDTPATMVFRCPMPHKVGEQYSPGAVDEKVRAEVATYAWMEAHCPDIPIPCLRGFGFSRGLQFTRRTQYTGYDLDPSDSSFDRPYLLLDFIDSGKGAMLSNTLRDHRETDPVRLRNLIHSISRIMLSLASKPQPHIGSLRFNDDGSTTLATRPLLCATSILESEGAPKVVDQTYTTLGSFADAMLRFREDAFRAQPNAVNDEEDCRLQMFQMVLLRRMKSHFVDRHYQGPFVLQFTDFHASNVFVDEEWNVVALIDLEYVCALPPSMMDVPHWLLVDAIDEVTDRIDDFGKVHELFVNILRGEESFVDTEHEVSLAAAIQDAWTSSACWFYSCFTSINGLACCLEDHLYRKFDFEPSLVEETRLARIMSSRWSADLEAFVAQKLHDKARYDDDLARHFDKLLDAT